MGSPSRNVQYHPPRLSEDRLNLPQPHSPSFAYTLLREIGNAPERDGIAVNSDDRRLINAALEALPALVGYAVESGWGNAHKLAHIAAPDSPLGGENATDEIGWWSECLLSIAVAIAEQPIVPTAAGFLPAISDGGACASFLVPAIDKDSEGVVDYERVHEIASEIAEFHIPSMSIAQDWDQIAKEWENLGVPVGRFGFREVTDWAKDSDRYKVINFIGVAACNSIPHETHRGPARVRPSVPWAP